MSFASFRFSLSLHVLWRRILRNRVPVKTARLPRRVRSLILLQLHLADLVLRHWWIVRKCRKFPMNFRRAEIWRILKRDYPRAERLIENRQRKLARPGLLLYHKFVQAGTRAHFETNVLDINDLGFHRSPLKNLKQACHPGRSEGSQHSTQPQLEPQALNSGSLDHRPIAGSPLFYVPVEVAFRFHGRR